VPARRICVVAALTTVVVAGAAAHQLAKTRRALYAERAARRLTAAMQARDLAAFQRQVEALRRDCAVVQAADRILDSALASHRTEGGHP